MQDKGFDNELKSLTIFNKPPFGYRVKKIMSKK